MVVMDYKEEQNGEFEALESIYYGDVRAITTEPFHKFSIPIRSEEYNADVESGLACDLVFTYTAKYPDEQPVIELEEPINIEEHHQKELLAHLDEQAKENLGMVMIFTLVSSAQEWLNVKWDDIKKRQDEEKLRKEKELEELEMKKFEGTKVTVESFLAWKKQFEEDLGIRKKKETNEKENRKLTGRELFITDNTLNESDLKFLDGEEVQVDESLFQDLEDLDIDDEDDPDFNPNNYNSDSS
ncbi:hypothetical protein ILUMI_20679 [Ignelater luminosus]|uniref:RWD domain-containing protein n=1 Tax=Ignelater luminosus TaxID=2038154 RepID=A0A8K0CG14_IGNLU|nr:hypothetical protein ILUMI_20679 [Ignelater luminosus]